MRPGASLARVGEVTVWSGGGRERLARGRIGAYLAERRGSGRIRGKHAMAGWSWAILFVAGLFEVGWAIGLKYADGFTRPLPSALTIAAMVLSVVLLSLALRSLPLGTAYAVWTGIGTIGTAILGIVLFAEPATALRLGCIGLIVAGIVGLKLAG